MQIIVNLEQEIVARYYKRGAPILFGIFWKHDQLCYPGEDWSDFGVVILGWWFRVIDQFGQGITEGKFSFMDGPYSIRASYDPSTGLVELIPESLEEKWYISLTHLASVLLQAAGEVCKKLTEFKIAEQDRLTLESGIERLKLRFKLQ